MYKNGCDTCDTGGTFSKFFINKGLQEPRCHNPRFFGLWRLWHLLLIHQIFAVEYKRLPWKKSSYNIDNDSIQILCTAGLRLRI